MRELVVISGKGGTGKTSIVASFASLARRAVVVDCDVDAADLHLLLRPRIQHREDFSGGSKAHLDPSRCGACGQCLQLCRFEAVTKVEHADGSTSPTYQINPLLCEGCGVCVDYCPRQAIELRPVISGQWFASQTRFGPLVHARLGVGSENSGKLVTQLRRTAHQMAIEQHYDWILCDGSPGIGCPVIASLTGADLALLVAEPTISGMHDLRRVAELAERLRVPGMLVVNKADWNPDWTDRLEQWAERHRMPIAGRIPYDRAVTGAQLGLQTVVEASAGPAALAIRAVWNAVLERLRSAVSAASDARAEQCRFEPKRMGWNPCNQTTV
jgi:MinD superfamily P-loop ATPase